MGFSDRQIRALQRGVGAQNIKTRVSDGRELSYLEGWFAIAEANRIFGFDGWDRETVEAKCIQARETRGTFSVVYTVRVRVTVWSGERSVVREGCGTGEGRGSQLGEAHDLALKAAETDATKRALVTFGKAFGLALYGGAQGRTLKQGRQHGQRPALAGRPADPLRLNKPVGRPILETPVQGAQAVDRGVTTSWHGSAMSHGPQMGGGHPSAPAAEASSTNAQLGVTESDNGEAAANSSPPPAVRATELRLPVDKSALPFGEPRRLRDKSHLRHVAAQPCLVCGALPADAHHIRFAQPKAFGRKVSDEFTVPLCRAHHRELHHTGNERAWWHDMGIDPIPIARRLWGESQAHEGSAGASLRAPASKIPDLPTTAPVHANQDAGG
jgi:DNA recombination protein Rad52